MSDGGLLREKVRFLYIGWPMTLGVSVLAAMILVWAYWDLVDVSLLIGWSLIHLIILIARLALLSAYRRRPVESSDLAWLWRFRLATFGAGASWGLIGLILANSPEPTYQAFVAFSLAGINAGVITTLSIDRLTTLLFVVPSLSPLAARFLLDPEPLALTMGLIVLLFLVFLVVTVTRIEAYLRDNVRLRLVAENQRRQIQLNEMRWRIAVESNGLGLWDWDLEHERVFCAGSRGSLLGLDEGDTSAVHAAWETLIHPEDRPRVRRELERHLAGETELFESEYRLIPPNGESLWILDRGRLIERDADGAPKRMIGVDIDITERKRIEAELRIAATVFESHQGVIITDANERIIRVNQAFVRISGYSSEEVVGQTPRLLKSGHHDRDFYAAMWSRIHESGSWQGEIWNRRKSGEIYPEWLSITAVGGSGGVTHYVATLHDITEHKAAEQAIRHLAFYDALTDLPNRRLLLDRLGHAQILSERTGRFGVLLFIDLDHFKTLNDTLGHTMGDLLLQQVARRLTDAVRDVDTVARLGGDEFVIMIEDLSEDEPYARQQAELIGVKVLETLSRPYQLLEHTHHSTPSIGILIFRGHDPSSDELIARADLAMYQAKQCGRGTLCLFEEALRDSADARLALRDELRQGIGLDQFVLLYQPQVDRDGCLLGAEILLRWANPRRAHVMPNEFIPLAEESGLILPLGYWVLRAACAQLRAWSSDPNWCQLSLSVNVSGRQFGDPSFVDELQAILAEFEIEPGRLKLELDEGLLGQGATNTGERLARLQSLGLGLVLDNFGAGFSPIAALKELPFARLKLCQSLVRDALLDPRMGAVAGGLIEMGRALGLEVLASGV